ncbi:carbohydrate ABC transporter permease [Anoxynatronum buryatiense]|uniref:Carbohydrate ABC transporter membrane protein 2, CUT1 family n=1 Tax=Anoxynatronum buryatiense TaxID=489973 RepID=A0AA45WY47_9CLOT|nr:carbohydrate ABC transporter permease [Anoxynatronum buryatiense]SMP67396.1 carbohydrate ABC transporter membrane protein 2, CUT1 family [Anoxynatronum buryatiense]
MSITRFEENRLHQVESKWKIIGNRGLFAGIMAFIVVWSLFPVYWMANNSLKGRLEQFSSIPTFYPHAPTLENYHRLFQEMGFLGTIGNSAMVAFVSSVLAVAFGSLAAYALSRYQFKGKQVLLAWILLTRIFPPVAFVIPLYSIMGNVGLLNTRIALILAYIVFNLPFAIWMLIGFFSEIPIEIEHSAQVDGASPFQVFRQIVLPLVAPGLAATAIFSFVMSWNEFMYAMIFIQSPDLVTVPVALSGLVTEYLVLWGPMSAGGILSTIPILVFVIFLQDYLIKGLTLGAVKG